MTDQLPDLDPAETQEWRESVDGVVDHAGRHRARQLMLSTWQRARERQVGVPGLRGTDYINTIPPGSEPAFPGDERIERRIRAYIRWNAAMMVHRAQRPGIGVGGHISTYASAASLYEVGFNHFFRGHDADGGGDQVWGLKRGGHDHRKVYAAYRAATEHTGRPTVILAKTIKGWTLGSHFEGRNSTHQMKKLTAADLRGFRDRLYLDIPDSALDETLPPYHRPRAGSEELEYLHERRRTLGGYLPSRTVTSTPLVLPGDPAYAVARRGSGRQEVATTMAFVRLLKDLMKDPEIGHRFVPIIPDEARTFGLDALFPSKKIYSPHGQHYLSVDREQLLSYQEDTAGVLLHEGISEAGSVASWTAAGTSYATHGEPMIPIYIFYSMFGFQRTGDGLWAAADQMIRGFLLGATAGRTTLNGEGLQHQDGHSLLLASTSPACVAYDAAYAFELGHIVRDALRRMYGEHRPGEDPDVFYYLTLYNEPILQPPEPDDVDVEGILAGMHRCSDAPAGDGPRAQILASGIAVPWAVQAQDLLNREWGVCAEVWSVTSWTELRREALAADDWNHHHPGEPPKIAYVTRRLRERAGPAVAVSDWMRAVPDQIAPWAPDDWSSLGTDGFGRSDTRTALRRHFGVDASAIARRVLERLVGRGELDDSLLQREKGSP